jgi:two-component system chemotaxis response regulator CheV
VGVTARVRSALYGFRIEHVVETAELGDVVGVPGAPPEILGVRNLRGEVLPIAELAVALGAPDSGSPQRLLVVEDSGRRAGLAVDEVLEVGALSDAGVQLVDVEALLDSVQRAGRA